MSPKNAFTSNGYLQLQLTKNSNGGYQGAQLQTWNKFCITGDIFITLKNQEYSYNNLGGIVAIKLQFPSTEGSWPAAWVSLNSIIKYCIKYLLFYFNNFKKMMGNLGRPQFEQSNMGVWPWSIEEWYITFLSKYNQIFI